MDSSIKIMAEKRRQKVLSNSEDRLARIKALAQGASSTKGMDNFVDFEVDSYANEPHKATVKTPQTDNKNSYDENGYSANAQADEFVFINNKYYSHDDEIEDNLVDDNFWQLRQNGNIGNSLMGTQRLQPEANGFMFNQNRANLFGDDLMAAMANMVSAFQQQEATQVQQQLQPIVKQENLVAVFITLGILVRVFLQTSSYNFNVVLPFLCLALPLGIMSWGRIQPPAPRLLSAVFLFIRNPLTKTMILNGLRLTTILRSFSKLFACYFFCFLMVHGLLEWALAHSEH